MKVVGKRYVDRLDFGIFEQSLIRAVGPGYPQIAPRHLPGPQIEKQSPPRC